MTREAIIQKTVKALSKLPAEKAAEVSDFADYVLKQYEEKKIQNGIEKLVEESQAFQFLHDDEDLYTINDIKESY